MLRRALAVGVTGDPATNALVARAANTLIAAAREHELQELLLQSSSTRQANEADEV